MDLQSDVKAYPETLTEEQRAVWMTYSFSYSSRAARASHSSEPSASVASLSMTNVERRAEESLDSYRTWEPLDAQELAQYASQPQVRESFEDESGTTYQFQAYTESSDPGSVQQPEEELTHEATDGSQTAHPAGDRASGTLSRPSTSPASQHVGSRASSTDFHGATSRSPNREHYYTGQSKTTNAYSTALCSAYSTNGAPSSRALFPPSTA